MRIALASASRSAGLMASALARHGIATERAGTVEEMFDLARAYSLDLILLDAAFTGPEATNLRRLRREVTMPIVVFGELADPDLSVAFFMAGADDVLESPVHYPSLAARMQAIVRRSRGYVSPVIENGPLQLDTMSRGAHVDGMPLLLTAKEYEVLHAMVLRRGHALSKDILLDKLYGSAEEPETRTIDVFVCKLRKKLAALGAPDLIVTVRGSGYMLRDLSRLSRAAISNDARPLDVMAA